VAQGAGRLKTHGPFQLWAAVRYVFHFVGEPERSITDERFQLLGLATKPRARFDP
jgi:hypothetical protein